MANSLVDALYGFGGNQFAQSPLHQGALNSALGHQQSIADIFSHQQALAMRQAGVTPPQAEPPKPDPCLLLLGDEE